MKCLIIISQSSTQPSCHGAKSLAVYPRLKVLLVRHIELPLIIGQKHMIWGGGGTREKNA
jgi:hypothetical protein